MAPAQERFIGTFLAKWGGPFLSVVVLGSIVSPFFYLTEFNAPYFWAFKYLSAPICVLCLGVGLCYRSEFQGACKRRASYWIFLVALPVFLVFFSGGWVTFANAILAPQRPFLMRGPIINKFKAGSRSISWVVVVSSDLGRREIEVTEIDFDRAQLGTVYSQQRVMGPLGFSYVRR
jgi:hypothetical protein